MNGRALTAGTSTGGPSTLDSRPAPCPIVGVGASAGGLVAFRTLLGALPGDSQLSIVLVQHLDPSRPTQLAELLAPHSPLPVSAVEDGTRLEPRHVYVVPEGHAARLEDGAFKLTDRDDSCRDHVIDTFLSSLATHGGSACGVILSGLGTDGVRGLEDIVAAGGLAFAQEPSTAEYDSMPRAAARVADVVAPIEEIAAELAQRGRLQFAEEPDAALLGVLSEILTLVSRDVGIDFSQYKQTTVRRRVTRRAMLLGLDDLAAYLGRLRGDPDEVRELVDDLLIRVTEFFRDPEVFEALRVRIFPEILAGKGPNDSVRIWVPACSTGEEVYGLLITLLEALDGAEERPAITVFGTDASEHAIRTARAGVYPAASCGAISADRLARYFEPVERGYRVNRDLRDMCIFARQDVTRDTPFSRLDLVSIRNVLIYFQPPLQKRVLAIIHYALLPKGFLVLGTSETAEAQAKLFSAFDKQRHIYRRREVSAHLPIELGTPSRISMDALQPAPLVARAEEAFDLQAEAEHLVLAAFAPPNVIADADGRIIHFSGDTSPYLEHGQGRASLMLLDMARPSVAYELREAFETAKTTHAPASREAIVSGEGQQLRVSLQVLPIATPTDATYYLIAFEEIAVVISSAGGNEELARLYESREERLRREFHALRARIRTISEEKDLAFENLRSANEEVSSSNEELRSVNEELETAKEELQSANEELITVNDELIVRNRELAQLNEVVTNFVSSAQIPMIMVDRGLLVRRYTPQATRVAHIVPTDEGRFLPHLRFLVGVPEIEQMVRRVIETGEPLDREVQDEAGYWFSMRIQPYRLSEGEIDGAVLTFIDINDLKYNMRRIERRAQLTTSLNDIEAALASTLEFEQIMQNALDEGVRALNADTGTIEVREGDAWVVRYQQGLRPEDVGRHLTDEEAPIATRAARTLQPQLVKDAAEAPEFNVGFVRDYQLRSILAVPLMLRGTVTGCLLFHSKERPRPFTSSEVDFARRLGAATSLALENARLLAEERRNARSAETLNTINEIVGSVLTPDELIARLVGQVSETAGADRCLVIEVTGESYTVTHVRGFAEELIGAGQTAGYYRSFARAAQERCPVLIGDTWGDPSTNKDFVVPYGVRAFQLLPLVVDDEVRAVLALAYDAVRTFDEADAKFAQRLANAMSLALKNARLYQSEVDARTQAKQELETTGLLLDVAETLATTDPIHVRLQSVAERLRSAMSHERASIDLWYADRHEIEVVAMAGGEPLPKSTYAWDELSPEAREAIESRRRAIVDYHEAPEAVRATARESGFRLALVVPIVHRNVTLGFIAVDEPQEKREFTDREIGIVEGVAAAVGTAIENARLFEAEREARREAAGELETTARLLDTSRVLAKSTDLRGLGQDLAELLLNVTPQKRSSIQTFDEERQEIEIIGSAGERAFEVGRVLPFEKVSSMARRSVTDKEPFIADFDAVPAVEWGEIVEPYRVRNLLAVPLVQQDHTIGTIILDDPGERSEFSEREIELVKGIAAQATVAISNARLFEAERQRTRFAQALARADAAIHSSLEQSEMMEEAIAEGAAALGASTGAITSYRDDRIIVIHSYGFGEDIAGLELSKEDERHSLLALETRQPVIVEDSGTDPRVDSEHVLSYGVAAVIVVPLMVGEQATGNLYYNFASPRHFRDEEVRFAKELGSSLSLALENARLYQEVQRASERLTNVLDSMIDGFVSVDREWRYMLVNPRAEEMLGKPASELLGGSMEELYPEMLGWPNYRRVMDDRRPETFEVWSIPLESWVEVHAYPTAEGISILFSDISERKATEEQLRRQNTVLEGINGVFEMALTTETEEQLGEACLAIAERMTGSAFGFVGALNDDGVLRDIAISDPGRDACDASDRGGHLRPLGEFRIHGIYGRVLQDGKAFFTNDPAHHPDAIGPPEGHPPLTSFLGAPLKIGRRVLGMIAVANKADGYDDNDLAMLEALAPSIVQALQRKRSEIALAEATQRLDAHINNSPLAVVEFDSEFRIRRWSDEAERMFGWKAEEVLGKGMREFRWVYEEDEALVEQESHNLLTAATPRGLNVNRNYRKDGTLIWCEWYDSAIYDAEGNMISILAQVLDITQRKRAEEAIRKTTERLAILAESARLLLTTEAPQNVVQTIAEQVMAYLDCQVFFNYLVEEDGSGMRLNAYAGIPPETAEEISHLDLGVAVCGCVARDGTRIVAEDVQHTPDERTDLVRSFGVQSYACHPLVYRGETIGTLSFGTRERTSFDDDEIELMRIVADQAATAMARKRAEDRLRASRAEIDAERTQLRRIIDQIPIGVSIVDTTGALLEINEANHRIWAGMEGLPPVVSVEGYTAYKAFHRDTGAPFRTEDYPVVQTLASGEQVSVVADIERFDDTEGTIRITSVPLKDSAARMTGVVVLTEDITTEVSAQRLDQALAEISATISATLDFEEILHRLVESSATALDVETAGLTVKQGDDWIMREFHGMPKGKMTSALTDHQLEVSLLAASQHEPLAINDIEQDPRVDRDTMRALGIRSLLAVPIVVQHVVVGVLLFHRRAKARAFTAEQVDFAVKLMGIATLSLENARLYERERRIADTLQEAVLTTPPPIPGTEFAHLYKPASESANVGGDFYDMFSVDERSIAIVVGDVSGKGIEAARLTSLLRDGIRAYAFEHLAPANVLQHVNDLVRRSSSIESFATGFLGILDISTGEMRYCSAGHPPAALLTSAGVSFLPGPSSSILGAFSQATFNEQATRLSPGDTIVLYTDGVTEARVGRELFGEERLADALRELASKPLAEIPQRLVQRVTRFGGGTLRDDTVVVCVRWVGAVEK